ncbi:hypothetical protein JHK85_052982 [Glycine max]|nr:hypothetical protein JHK85_052982 [Glycine max]
MGYSSATRKPHARLPCNIVNIEHNHKLFLESRGPNALDGLQGFCFETTSDGHGDADVAQDIISRCESIREHMFLPFYDLLVRLEDSATKGLVPPVTCLVSDCAMSFTIQVAEELSLPIVLFQPASACSLLSGLHFRAIFDKGLIQLKADLVMGGSVILSSEFVNETSDRGLIASWRPQEQVLNQTSIGGFLTHCGWNSTIESICAGVPMLCWPFYVDQPTNCIYICNEWNIGVEIDTDVKREDVEKLVNELMVGEKGKKMRQKVMELKKKAGQDTI